MLCSFFLECRMRLTLEVSIFFAKSRRLYSMTMTSFCQQGWFECIDNQKKRHVQLFLYFISIVSADSLSPLSASPCACKGMAKLSSHTWGLCLQKQVFQAEICNCSILWDAIIYPSLRYLLLATKSSYIMHIHTRTHIYKVYKWLFIVHIKCPPPPPPSITPVLARPSADTGMTKFSFHIYLHIYIYIRYSNG